MFILIKGDPNRKCWRRIDGFNSIW